MKKNLQRLKDADLVGKKILIRGDLDVDDGENPRVESVREMVRFVLEKKPKKIKVIGHRETNFPICEQLRLEFPETEFDDTLRDDPGEKSNDEVFAEKMADDFEVYINEAFASSHRKHASIVSLPEIIKKKGGQVYLGLRFEKEIEMLDKVTETVNSNRRSILVIGGVKIEDKQAFAERMKDKFSAVLKGGLLPGVVLRTDGLDISEEEIGRFETEIENAEVILAAGVMGKYEDQGASEGTRRVLTAIANNTQAYKVAGGGDIEMAISTYGLTDKFNWISVGGGAMLEYLSTGTLPGIEVLK